MHTSSSLMYQMGWKKRASRYSLRYWQFGISVRHLLTGRMFYFSFLCAATERHNWTWWVVTQFRRESVHFSFVDWSQVKWSNEHDGQNKRKRVSCMQKRYVHLLRTDLLLFIKYMHACIHAHHNNSACAKTKAKYRVKQQTEQRIDGLLHIKGVCVRACVCVCCVCGVLCMLEFR